MTSADKFKRCRNVCPVIWQAEGEHFAGVAGSVFSVRFPLRSQRSRAATKLEPGDKKGQYHNAVSVWVVRDITRLGLTLFTANPHATALWY